MRSLVLALLFLLGLAVPASAQVFDNRGVIALHRAGFGPEVIVAKIRALPCNYDISTDGLIALKSAGVGQGIIAEMVVKCTGATRAQGAESQSADPLAQHPPGIYLSAGGPGADGLALLRPAISAGTKFTGNGSLLFPYMAKMTVPQAHAQQVASSRRPTFYFYFDAGDRKVNSFGTVASIAAQSPREFSLVRFRVDGSTRQFVVGRVQPFVQVIGIDPKNALPFDISEVGDSIFRIGFSSDLEPGEYAFVLPGEKDHFRIYDFSVGAAPAGQ